MLREIWSLRYFCFALAKHDLKERYRRSVLGIAWSLLKPAAITFILTFVFSNVFSVAVSEYVPFLFLGLVLWQFLTESMTQGCNAFRLGHTYLRLCPLPMAIFPLRVVLLAGVQASIALSAAIVCIACMQGSVSVTALVAIVPGLVIFVIVAWSLACIAGILHTFFSDTQPILEISLQVLFYVTPIIYLPESVQPTGWLAQLMRCNPFAAMLELIRRPLLHGDLPDVASFVIALTFALGVAGIAWLTLRRVERRLVLWL